MKTNGERVLWKFYKARERHKHKKDTIKILFVAPFGRIPILNPLKKIWKCGVAHLKDLHKRQKAVLKRPLVITVENKWLQKLQNSEYIAEECHVVLLAKLLHV